MDTTHVSSGSFIDSPSKYGRDQKYMYKKSSYQYSNTDGNIESSFSSTAEPSVNQLDTLLENLKIEREQARDKDIHTSTTSYKTIEPTGTVTKTTRIIKSHQLPVEQESAASYNNSYITSYEPVPSNEISTYKSNKSVSKNINTSTNFYESDSQSPVLLENDAKNLLSDNLLPVPGTKVTTTVRTYTYEIPAEPGNTNTINNRTLLYKNDAYNTSRNEYVSKQSLPPTVVYSSESYNTSNVSNNTMPPNNTLTIERTPINRVHEINETTQDYRTIRNDYHLSSQQPPPLPPTNKTIVYNINRTEHNTSTVQGGPPSGPNNNYPSHTLVPQGPQQSPHHNHPNGGTTNYYYRESTNTVNTINGGPPGGPGGPGGPGNVDYRPNVTIEYPRDNYGPRDNKNIPPQHTTNIMYNYSTTSTTNSRRGGPYNDSPTQPGPFPVDGNVYPNNTGNPPTNVDELLHQVGHDNVDGPLDTTQRRKREIETGVATANTQIVPSVNKAGPAVYYPPGHDFSMKKEQSMSASGYQASGKYAKASGMYEFESSSKSKSSSKSGAAVVPVCLPLCCAMPCSIM